MAPLLHRRFRAPSWKAFVFLVLSAPLPVLSNILVVGSANADTFLRVARLPTEGENLTLLPGTQPVVDLPGGKGCTQAVAASKLLSDGEKGRLVCHFLGQFGNDLAAKVLQQALHDAGVDTSHCGIHEDLATQWSWLRFFDAIRVGQCRRKRGKRCGWMEDLEVGLGTTNYYWIRK
jgi:hypothetical protein